MIEPSVAQQRAIGANGNVLVVAGAGTGKTSTLVARCLRLIEAGSSLENILMVTFTESAAAELRHRIRGALEQRRTELGAPGRASAAHALSDPFDQQLALLDTAHISTLHGFCLHLIRAHFHALDIDPQVMVLDERQTAPLISETLDEVLGNQYAGGSIENLATRELIRAFGRGSDELIRGLMVRLHRYAQSRGDTSAWLDRQEAYFQVAKPTVWREWLPLGAQSWRQEWRAELESQPQVPAVAESIGVLERLPPAPSAAEWAAALDTILAADGDAKKWARRKTELRPPIKNFFDEAVFLRSQFPGTDGVDPLAEDWTQARLHLLALLRLTREFTRAYADAKRNLGGVDFADLEQFTLRLLRERDEVSQRCRAQFQHVFVDECQDINAAQDAILTALSRSGDEANRFLVGDVKQSIYRFRLANPNIFRGYEREWGADSTSGTSVALSDNFRSREAILIFVNRFFAPLMRESIGGLAYGAEAHLRFGAAALRPELSALADSVATPPDHCLHSSALGMAGPAPRVELHWLTQQPGETQADEDDHADERSQADTEAATALVDLAAVEREARLIALRLCELEQGGHLIWDRTSGGPRPVAWRDMVVLLRSPGSKVEAFAKEFHRVGVPLQAARGGFFDALEVLDLLNLLRLLDNPLQDVPLLAVLRSSLVGLSLDELAEIRAHNREKYFWLALRRFQQSVPPVGAPASVPCAWRKADAFLRQHARWRQLVRQTSLAHGLEAALAETQYEALLLAEPRGVERVANVRRLLERARDFDSLQRQGLFRFLRYLDLQQAAGLDEEPAPAATENAVRLMSIHKSKGLEFPVVVVADLGKPFNLQGLRDPILLDEQYGLCPQIVLPASAARYPSLPYWLAQRRESRELRGEELRLLYVAMTRARDTLILTASGGKNPEQVKWLSANTPAIPEREIATARSSLDWVRLWLPLATHDSDWQGELSGRNDLFRWRIYAPNDPDLALVADQNPPSSKSPNAVFSLGESELKTLQQRMAWHYPFEAATHEAAKTSVSALRRRRLNEAEESAAARFAVQDRPFQPPPAGGELSAAEIGTAHHVFLQFLKLELAGSEADLKAQVSQMTNTGVLSAEQAAVLDFAALTEFWQSELGRTIRAQAPEDVQRELPFTARLSPADLAALKLPTNPDLPPDEFLVVQGVVDLAVILPEEIWLIDFKTDRVATSALAEKIRLYQPQIKLYALALARIYRRPVTQTWLHFLTPKRSERLA